MSNDQKVNSISRRSALASGAALFTAASAISSSRAQTPASNNNGPLGTSIAIKAPTTEFVYESIVDIAEMIPMGEGPLGERRIVPITGGVFEGPGLKGKVLPGGADRQLVRKDGARLLHALYELQTDDGAIITVDNKVLVRTPQNGPRYASSHITLSAPAGKYGWLNDFVYAGTLDSLRPARNAVLIRVFKIV